ncbi:CpaF family protein [Candidatus Pacearchaeota archaeon CG10_big_fil_rev_8_21_14_0_10_34_76]|nr:MAG: CpaF family protein [Candidatus Pacearchaeota archaeon CG10_big_fil_rev_8_21_14_0_10_34_76]
MAKKPKKTKQAHKSKSKKIISKKNPSKIVVRSKNKTNRNHPRHNISVAAKLPEKKSEEHLIKEVKAHLAHVPHESHPSEKIDKYEIEVDSARVTVEIRKENVGYKYYLNIPKINIATEALLKDIKNDLITMTTISMKELSEQKSFSAIKQRFMQEAKGVLNKKLPRIDKKTEEYLIGTLIQEMLGLGEIEFLINDPSLEEIVIPSSEEPVRVYAKKYGWLETNIQIHTEEEIVNYANIIARRVGRQITVLSPLLDAHLVTGDRINAVLYPINTKGNTITIRKFARDPYTMVDMITNKTCSIEVASLLWLAIEYEMNVLISGGTASGKTSFLNSCMPFIPPNHRIISIEDTRELMLPDFLYWTPMVTRTPNPEGKGSVNMLDLLINSLRMRPDRIILGEMRKHDEAMVLFEAMHTGHSVYATVHADSAPETISRLVNPPLSVPPNLLKSVNLNVVMFRDRRRGIRRVLQVAEFETSKEGSEANLLYRWSPEEDKIVQHSESSRFFEDIQRHTGLSQREVQKNLETKKEILAWLIKENIRSLPEVGKVINLYYKNLPLLTQALHKKDKNLIFKN